MELVLSAEGEIFLEGVSISEGIAIGTIYFLKPSVEIPVPEFTITTSQVKHEIGRYHQALSSSREELERLQLILQREGATEAIGIIDSHIQMLDDPFLTQGMEERIGQMLQNTESVFQCVLNEYKSIFDSSTSGEMKDRFTDVQDLSNRILKHLHPHPKGYHLEPEAHIPSHSILSTYELIPTQTAAASPNHIQAFVTEIGGKTSHAALIARSKGIPYISSIHVDLMNRNNGKFCIIDGNRGLMIVQPSDKTIEEYSKKKKVLPYFIPNNPMGKSGRPITKDGVEVEVQANLESSLDLRLLKYYDVESVGLVRSEFLYLKKEIKDFKEEEQYDLYKKFFKSAPDINFTFRVFDIGSDKKFFRSDVTEPNPALGCRSTRFLMKHPEMFRGQLRAVLRAAIHANVKILLPLICDAAELIEAKAFIEKVQKELRSEGKQIPEKTLIGCMVEVPAFVIMCDKIIPLCDFLSIGTNDLVQYTLVADRSDPRNIHGPMHPSILRMIYDVTEKANLFGVPISICGEIASYAEFTQILIGLGIRTLSCTPRFIPVLKDAVASIDSRKARALAQKLLTCATTSEVEDWIKKTAT